MGSILSFRDFSEFKASAWVLIAANMLPLFGVIFFGWDVFSIVALYWFENVVIGAINVLKIITCNPRPDEVDWSALVQSDDFRRLSGGNKDEVAWKKLQYSHHASKLFFVPFFVFHYGLFCLGHGVFVFAFFGPGTLGLDPLDQLFNLNKVFTSEHLWWAVGALVASHVYSFFVNYLGRGEFRRTAVLLLMIQPYARIVVLQIALLFGGFFVMFLGSPIVLLVLLIAGKTALDLSLHLREHERIANAEGAIKESQPTV
jgi:hypothetical protein